MRQQNKFGYGHVPSIQEDLKRIGRLKPLLPKEEPMLTIDVTPEVTTASIAASIKPEVTDTLEQDKATKNTPAKYFSNIAKGIQRIFSRLIQELRTVLGIYR
jgi:hypothetical protein